MACCYSFDQGQSFSADVKPFKINLIQDIIYLLLVHWSILHTFRVRYFYHSTIVLASRDFTFARTGIKPGRLWHID